MLTISFILLLFEVSAVLKTA